MCTEHSFGKDDSVETLSLLKTLNGLPPFGLWISWQYFVPVCTQPNFFANPVDFPLRKVQWNFSLILLRRWGAVSSSFLSILASMKFRTSKVTCSAGLPGVGAFKDCRYWKRLRKHLTLSRLVWHSSSVRILTILLMFLIFDRSLTIFAFSSCVKRPMVVEWINHWVSQIDKKRTRIEGVAIWIEIVLHITQPMTFLGFQSTFS